MNWKWSWQSPHSTVLQLYHLTITLQQIACFQKWCKLCIKLLQEPTIFAPSPNFPRVCFRPYLVPERTAEMLILLDKKTHNQKVINNSAYTLQDYSKDYNSEIKCKISIRFKTSSKHIWDIIMRHSSSIVLQQKPNVTRRVCQKNSQT